jgi:hypothetical protein
MFAIELSVHFLCMGSDYPFNIFKFSLCFCYNIECICIVPITIKVVSSNLAHSEAYSMQHNVIKFVSDLWFSPGTPVSSTNKTEHPNIAEIFFMFAIELSVHFLCMGSDYPFNIFKFSLCFCYNIECICILILKEDTKPLHAKEN